MRRISVLAALTMTLAATTLAACAQSPSGGAGAPATPPSAAASAFQARAADVVSTWEAAGMAKTWRLGFVPLEPSRISLPADPGFTEDTKIAYGARCFDMHAGLPLPPPPGMVMFPDGSRMKVDLVNAEDAFEDMSKQDDPACSNQVYTPLVLTQITLGTVTVLTTRGNATAPAWLFTAKDLHAPIAYMAVAPKDVAPVPTPPRSGGGSAYPADHDLRTAATLISVDGATVRFTVAVGDCDKDIKPLVYETADTIALGGSAILPDGICDLVLKFQPVTVTLAKPVGDRALIDGLGGKPLTVRPTR